MMGFIRLFYNKYLVLITIVIISFNSCVRDSLDDCPVDQELLYIKVTDILTGKDITNEEELENLTLYFFDSNESLLKTIEVSPSTVENSIPVDVTGMNLDGGYVSAWANLNDLIQVPSYRLGNKAEELELTLVSNTVAESYFLCPGDLFFAFQRLSFNNSPGSELTKKDTIEIKRKNAKLHLTVRGLKDVENIDQYYFKISTLQKGYNFEGTPLNAIGEIWEVGELNALNDFVSPEPYMMIHSNPSDVLSDDNCIVVRLMQAVGTRTDADKEIIVGSKDTNGNYIQLESGKTTNVFLEIIESGDLRMEIMITDWDVIYQWERW